MAAADAGNFPAAPGLTSYVARFVVETNYEAIPADVIELGKKSILDGFGLALAGSRAQSGPLCLAYLDSLGICQGQSTLIGSSRKTAPQFAAFVNGVSIHADDYDDTQLSAAKDRVYGLLVHPTVPVLPAAFAIAERGGVSGKEFMLAYHVAVEVECKIAEAIAPRHYQDGFHSTGTCGPFGSAAACAKLMRFDVGKTLNAFGIAGSEAGGLRENFGTMTKPFQAGRAAESGIEAAQLASLGWTAAQQILEAQRGFFHAAGGSFEPTFIMNRLGKPWTFASPGVSLKPYPSGSLSHPAMTEMMRLIEKNDIKPAQVEKVEIGANHNMTTALLHHHPKTGLEAKFSMEFCLAILLLERKAGLAQFTDESVKRADVQAMIGKVMYYVDPEAESAGFDKMTSILKIYLKDGRVISGRSEFGKGSPADPMSFEEAAAKFRGCAEYADWPKDKTEKIIAFIQRLENAADMKELAPLLTA
ncbi:MAG: MmgE/PrpD family protein [Acidobacteriota bacterium]|nr:MmgE/PrpD family protein [Acidobacteriota bacterium]